MKKPQTCDNPLKAFESASVSTGSLFTRTVLHDLTSDLMLTKPPKSLAKIYISGVNPVKSVFIPNHESYSSVIAHSTLLQTFTKVVK